MNIFLIALVVLFLPVSLTIMLTCQTLQDRKRRKQGLPPKRHHNIKDLNIIEVITHDADD